MRKLEKHNSFFILLVAILVLSSAFAIGSWFPRALATGEVLLENIDLISDVLTFVSNDYVEEVPPRELITNAIQGMLQELDPHSNLLTPELAENLSERTNGEYSGIGIEFGGGVRSPEAIQQALEAGADEIILGSSLMTNENRLADWWECFPDRLVAGVDARAGRVVIRGWQETSRISAVELIRRIEGVGFSRVIYTDVATDGMMAGSNLTQLKMVAENTCMKSTASGGIGRLADIQAVKRLERIGVTGIIVGRAFYEGKLTIEELAVC